MAIEAQETVRKFKFSKGKDTVIDLPDPGSHISPQQVQKFYAGTYPELTNADLKGPTIDRKTNVVSYEFVVKVGTKG
jgi:PRTRC genetic system protein C